MLDFLIIKTRSTKRGVVEVYPNFIIKKSKDLMIRGGDFYAIWVADRGLWSTDEEDVIQLIDREVEQWVEENRSRINSDLKILHMWDSESGMIDRWHKYCKMQMRDSYHSLDDNLIFSNRQTTREDYATKRLPYPLCDGDISAYDKLMSTLYDPDERAKIEWAIGCIISGDSKTIQKFMVLYGAAGTGKSTILNVIQQLFEGYYSTFDAKALGSSNDSFALEAFKSNPLIAIQHDGDLSRIEDNTRINSLVSHEEMTVNEKFKSAYTNRFRSFLIMGTNKPVRITDAKSGLIRRLIDVTPSGNKLPSKEYKQITGQIKFELGAIAKHCLDFYNENPGRYDNYIPTAMLGATNDFYNFVVSYYHIFKREDSTTLKESWEMYKNYCEEARVPYPLSQRNFKEELKNYFKEFQERFTDSDGSRIRSYYQGFLYQKFNQEIIDMNKKPDTNDEEEPEATWLDFKEQPSIFDQNCADCPAQYAVEYDKSDNPMSAWDLCKTKLSDLDTSKLHYVRVPLNHIVIDFDIPDENGEKSLEKNLEAAKKWPPTYAELSKSGKGIHLHYIYDGDPEELSRVFDEYIEVKVFTGKSSIRRKLSKCVNLDISTIQSGLPLKGVNRKLVNKESIKSEKGLRTMIKRNLEKEIHPYTKPSIDFINKILDDAYESGLHYDVSDMKQQVLVFAMNSSHNSDYCLRVVNNMKFCSDEPSAPIVDNEKPIAFFDIECFPNLLMIGYKNPGPDQPKHYLVNPTSRELSDIVDKFRWIGFNCRGYDNHIFYARMIGKSLVKVYQISRRIIENHSRDAMFGEAYNLSYTDIYDYASAGNKMSLKKLEIKMGIHHQELGLPWDKPVPEKLWPKVQEYLGNDIDATEAAHDYLKADWTARQILADLADMTVNDTTNTLTQRIIFGNDKKPQIHFHYRDLSQPVHDMDEETYQFLAEACPEMMSQTHGSDGSLLPYFPGYKFEFGKSSYRGEDPKEGGYVYAEPGLHVNVALLDIASMHPHSAIAEVLFGIKYTKAFRDIVEGRVSIKHKAWDEVDHMLDGKLKPYIQKVIDGELTAKDLANALKTAINAVYGQSTASYDNPFRDKRNKDNIVAKRGALFMIDLKHAVQEKGFTVAHIKTDSIKIPNATPEIIQFVMDFGKKYGYTFEHEATYERMCLVNDAVYVARYLQADECKKLYGYIPGDNESEGGKWTATGKQFQVPYVFKTLFSKEDILFEDLCETFSVQTALYLDMNESLPDVSKWEKELGKLESQYRKGLLSDTSFERTWKEVKEEVDKGHDYHFIGKVGQFCPMKPGSGGGLLVRQTDGYFSESKYTSATGAKGFYWMESEMVRQLQKEDSIDRGFYNDLVNTAVATISKYCDFEWFVSDQPPIPRSEDFMNIPDGYGDEMPFN